MDPGHFADVGKPSPSAFYGAALSGSVCFPMPLMYSHMNTYPFLSTPFLPVHHSVIPQHGVGMQDSSLLHSSGEMVSSPDSLKDAEDLSSRALAFLQGRYQTVNKCFFSSASRKPPTCMTKYGLSTTPSVLELTNAGSSDGLTKDKLRDGQDLADGGIHGMSPSDVFSDKDCYVQTPPSSEMEEMSPGSKCSIDGKQKVARWTADPNQPPTCPVCGRSLCITELSEHYHLEIDRLCELTKNKEWLAHEEDLTNAVTAPSAGMGQMRFHVYPDVEKRCPEFRKETYLRVRSNRMNRLGARNTRPKKLTLDEAKQAWKQQRSRQLCIPKEEDDREMNGDGTLIQDSQKSMLMLQLTVEQLTHQPQLQSEERPEGEAMENRNTCLQQKGLGMDGDHPLDPSEKIHEKETPPLDPCNGYGGSPDVGNYPPARYILGLLNRCPSQPQSRSCAAIDVKCVVCLEPYKKPVVSVCCWHVHCEHCWLKSLGAKRLCPQCDTITSPTDLRRIHL